MPADYCRTQAMDAAIAAWAAQLDDGEAGQVVALGAGFDTAFFRFRDTLLQRCRCASACRVAS